MIILTDWSRGAFYKKEQCLTKILFSFRHSSIHYDFIEKKYIRDVLMFMNEIIEYLVVAVSNYSFKKTCLCNFISIATKNKRSLKVSKLSYNFRLELPTNRVKLLMKNMASSVMRWKTIVDNLLL